MSIWTDGATAYLEACQVAATNVTAFNNFKRDPALREVWEHISESQGKAYLYVTKGLDPHCDFHPAIVNDRFGNPFLMELSYDFKISPGTSRYVWMAYMLKRLFGSRMDGMDIVEIGGGYGGLAVVLHQYFKPDQYEIFDLPEPAALQLEYAAANDLELQIGSLCQERKSSLAISTFALSELSDEQQAEYADKVLRHADRGFIVSNEPHRRTFDLIKSLDKPNVEIAYEPVQDWCYMVWWGAK